MKEVVQELFNAQWAHPPQDDWCMPVEAPAWNLVVTPLIMILQAHFLCMAHY